MSNSEGYGFKATTMEMLEDLLKRHPEMEPLRPQVLALTRALVSSFRAGGKLLVCGNGGSAADAEHIAGELLNKFRRHRPLDPALAAKLPPSLAAKLEGSLPAVSLVSMTGALSAIANDIDWEASFAQQVLGLANAGDVLIAISTSGNSPNCVAAVEVAKAKGAVTYALTGAKESTLARICDGAIRVPATETYKIQELHLPLYHAVCEAVEEEMF